jgi:hypothetical protein
MYGVVDGAKEDGFVIAESSRTVILRQRKDTLRPRSKVIISGEEADA